MNILKSRGGKNIPKIIVQHTVTLEEFKVTGTVKINEEWKIVLEGKTSIICSFKKLVEDYYKIGTYE